MRRQWIVRAITSVSGLAVAAAFSGQQPAGPPIFKSTTRAVEINVSVRDAAGNPVRGLRKEDFTVTDNGKPREIQLFSGDNEKRETPAAPLLPDGIFSNRFGPREAQGRVTALVIDTVLPLNFRSGMQLQSQARDHAMRAVERIQPGDTIAIYSIEGTLKIRQGYTSDREKLVGALRAFLPVPSSPSEFRRNPFHRVLFALRDIADHMAAASGRKSVVWISRGFPNPQLVDRYFPGFSTLLERTIQAFNDDDVALYPVDPAGIIPGNPFGGGGLDANMMVMRGLAQETGGRAFTFRNDMDQAITEALDDSQYTYELGFYLSGGEFDGKFHDLTVKLPGRSNVTVNYRKGYSATPEPREIDRDSSASTALLSPFDASAVGIDAAAKLASGPAGKEVQLSFGLDPATVKRDKSDGLDVDETFLEIDANGKQIAKITETLHMNLSAQGSAVRYTRNIKLADGAVTLRVLIRDKTSGHSGSLTIPLAGLGTASSSQKD